MARKPTHFTDRKEAGEFLAAVLAGLSGERPVVVGLPRGGVVVAAAVARRLNADLDVIIAGKLRAPYNPELAIGAVTEDGAAFLNRAAIRSLRVTDEYIEREKAQRLEVVTERLKLYREVKKQVPLEGRTVVIVDDGLATGSTMISAVQAAKASGAKKIIVAVPGGPPDTVEKLEAMDGIDQVVCPLVPESFYAVSQLYLDFRQVEDDEVVRILKGFGGDT